LKRVHKRALLKVANTAANVLRKSILVERIEVPETIEFQELIYIYCAKPSEMKEKQVHGGPLVGGDRAIMANLSEPQFQNLINKHPDSIIEYSKKNLGRVYPFGLRFDSSNADPMLAWSHGFQMAVVNLQGRDRPVWLAHGFFQANGNTGYVKKEDIFFIIITRRNLKFAS
jgi:phosphatidylinositol phospholipase C delta